MFLIVLDSSAQHASTLLAPRIPLDFPFKFLAVQRTYEIFFLYVHKIIFSKLFRLFIYLLFIIYLFIILTISYLFIYLLFIYCCFIGLFIYLFIYLFIRLFVYILLNMYFN